MPATAVKMLWTVYVLMAQVSVQAVISYKGLVCTNDFINNVSCMWNSSDLNPGVDCLVSGVKKTFKQRKKFLITQSCKLVRSGNSVPGCSLVFENTEFSGSEVMPNISMKCNGTLMENETIINYKPTDHIKMHRLAAPNVSSTATHVHISWSLGPRVSDYFSSGYMFQVQCKQNHETWRNAITLSTQQQEEFISMEQLKGFWQFRVRVNPEKRTNSQWSQWSPTTSWVGPSDEGKSPEKSVNLILIITAGLAIPLILMGVFALYRLAKTRGLLKGKPVPSPSEYFHTLHSVHGGNLKKWLNPASVPESFFTASSDHFSTVEVSKAWDVSPSPSTCSSSTSAMLHFQSCPSVGSNTSRVVDSATSSSCFSNMGYFMSSSSGSSAQTSSPPAYFTCEKDFRSFQSFISPPGSTCQDYERLKRGPHSPDSGFCTGNEDKMNTDVGMDEDLEDLSSPLTFPLLLQHLMAPSPSPPTLHQPFSPAQFSTDIQQVEDPTADLEAWPVSGAMCRPSSMPVDSSKTGYLTIKELHATFSNKSF